MQEHVSIPPVSILLALTTPPLSPTPVWYPAHTVSKIYQIRWSRGRSSNSERFMTATAEIVMGNHDGTWDPDWSGSPLYPYLDVGLKLQVGFTRGSYLPQITGYIESIQEGHRDFVDDVVTVRISDGFSLLSLAHLTTLFNTVELAGTRIRKILDHADVAWPGTGLMVSAGHRNLDAGELLMQVQEADDTSALELIDQVVFNSERGMFFMAADGAVRFIERNSVLDTPQFATSQGIFGDGPGEMPYMDFKTARDVMRVRNRVIATRQGGAPQVAEDAASIQKYARRDEPMPEQLLITDNDSYDVAAYESFRQKTPVTRIEPLIINPAVEPTTLWPFVLGDNLQWRYTVRKRRALTGQLKEYQVRVEGIDTLVRFGPSDGEPFWERTVSLGNVDPNEYWILNDSKYKLDTTARWSP